MFGCRAPWLNALPHQELGRKVLVPVQVAVRYAEWLRAGPRRRKHMMTEHSKHTSQVGDSQVWPCRFRVLIRQL
jgi:hypothetical protein